MLKLQQALDILQELGDVQDLRLQGLTNEEIEGYLEFFAANKIKPKSTIIGFDNGKFNRNFN